MSEPTPTAFQYDSSSRPLETSTTKRRQAVQEIAKSIEALSDAETIVAQVHLFAEMLRNERDTGVHLLAAETVVSLLQHLKEIDVDTQKLSVTVSEALTWIGLSHSYMKAHTPEIIQKLKTISPDSKDQVR